MSISCFQSIPFLYFGHSMVHMVQLWNKKCSDAGPKRRCSGPEQYQYLFLGLDRYRYQVSADTGQYQWVSVSADTYLSISADTSSTVICLHVSAVKTVATHAYSFKPIPYFCTYTPHTYITSTHLYPAQNCIFSTKNFCSLVSILLRSIVLGVGRLHGIGLTLPVLALLLVLL